MRIGDIPDFKMSFAITTGGSPSRVILYPKLIEAIQKQGIPRTEINVVGNIRPLPKIPNVQLWDRPDWASEVWVTRMMNTGVMHATGQLVMMLHDDVVLADDFWQQLQEEDTEAWDFLTTGYLRTPGPFEGVQLAHESVQHPRWTIGGPQGHRILNDEDAWDPWSYPSGELLIGWSHAFARQLWDNHNNHKQTRGTAQAFDVQFGHEANQKGLRFAHRPNIRAWVLEL
jgi:hypothetical protein